MFTYTRSIMITYETYISIRSKTIGYNIFRQNIDNSAVALAAARARF